MEVKPTTCFLTSAALETQLANSIIPNLDMETSFGLLYLKGKNQLSILLVRHAPDNRQCTYQPSTHRSCLFLTDSLSRHLIGPGDDNVTRRQSGELQLVPSSVSCMSHLIQSMH